MRVYFLSIVVAYFFLSTFGMAKAQDLNAEETEALLIQGPWNIQAGGEHNYFIWKHDGTLCVKMYGPDDENCDDNGVWSRDGQRVCYRLQWWGKAVDIHDLCFSTVKTESDKYEAIDANGLTALTFMVLSP